jgi:hypothetical protein
MRSARVVLHSARHAVYGTLSWALGQSQTSIATSVSLLYGNGMFRFVTALFIVDVATELNLMPPHEYAQRHQCSAAIGYELCLLQSVA